MTNFSNQLISEIPPDINSDVYKAFDKRFKIYGGEAVYIYSFEEQKMLFAKGWEDLLGYPDAEFDMRKVEQLTDPAQLHFTKAMNEASIKFGAVPREGIEKCSYTHRINKIHKNGHRVPLFWRVSVFDHKDGHMTQIMGHAYLLSGEPFGEVVYYETHGPGGDLFDELLAETHLFESPIVSKKEIEVLALASEGFAYKEIAEKLGISQSAVEKRIRPMFKKFDVTGLPQLISFAYKNRILL